MAETLNYSEPKVTATQTTRNRVALPSTLLVLTPRWLRLAAVPHM